MYLLKTKNFGDIPLHQQRPLIDALLSDDQYERLKDQKEPRIMCTHMPVHLLPETVFKGKVIYVYRNAKDVATSMYHHYCNQISYPFDWDFEKFARYFMEGNTWFGPYGKHLQTYSKAKSDGKEILFISYEEMKKNPKDSIRKLAKFLGEECDDELADRIIDAVAVDKMRHNKNANGSQMRTGGTWKDGEFFIRKGQVGNWKEHFTDAKLLADFEDFIKREVPSDFIQDD